MSLQEEINRLKGDNEALTQEFVTHTNSSNPEHIKKRLAELIPDAIEQISFLLNHSDSDSTRFNTAKYVLTLALAGDTTDDALKKLLNELATPKDTIIA